MIDAQVTPQAILLKNYSAPAFLIPDVTLRVVLDEEATRVCSRLTLNRNGRHRQPLKLDGEALNLISVKLNGKALKPGDYQQTPAGLTVPVRGESAVLEIETEINPTANTQLMGLYRSGGIFCTQCEAEGFRRITYFLDRPDVLSRYSVTLEADRAAAPVLLANGNCVATGEAGGGRHWAQWDDPFPKPCYLFAMVAGDLVAHSDRFTTMDGRDVALNIWVRAGDVDRCGHAMSALQKSMAWDEARFGRAYDLDVYNIVAVHDFNFGAMENKGLNIFNSKYVLAKPETATDQDFDAVESVIAHEYFHNWTGNRITCRDWFQLSLKEGLTVYRDQEFSADMGSRGLKRIDDVRTLRAIQFPEDAGPLAHPIRPESYIEISNFYTATVYNKGAEVIRMMETILGPERFRAGMDLYFQRHDGQAVTCEDFIAAMEDASGADLKQFRLWYSQAGTPRIEVRLDHDAATRTARMHLAQVVPDTPGQRDKAMMHIPVRFALLGAQSGKTLVPETVHNLTARRDELVFENVTERPVASLLRGFSAPVVLHAQRPRSDLAFLARHDDDPFARYEAMQQLGLELLLEGVRGHAGLNGAAPGSFAPVDPLLVEAVEATLRQAQADPALVAEAVVLPSEAYIGDQMAIVDVESIHAVRQQLRIALSRALRPLWWELYHANAEPRYRFDADAKGKRRLRNIALQYLMVEDDHEATAAAFLQFTDADNMTDRIAALTALASSNAVEREEALSRFYTQWKDDPLVIDKWFTLQALSYRPDTLQQVVALSRHEAFSLTNPNRLRSLIGAFAANQVRFHDGSGAGYRFLYDQVLAVDKLNSQTAARLVAPLGRWRRFDAVRGRLMRESLQRILTRTGLSKDVFEMVSKSLG